MTKADQHSFRPSSDDPTLAAACGGLLSELGIASADTQDGLASALAADLASRGVDATVTGPHFGVLTVTVEAGAIPLVNVHRDSLLRLAAIVAPGAAHTVRVKPPPSR